MHIVYIYFQDGPKIYMKGVEYQSRHLTPAFKIRWKKEENSQKLALLFIRHLKILSMRIV